MAKENYNVIGVMSGTSLDGIDLAHVNLNFKDKKWGYTIHEALTVPYTNAWVERLKEAVDYTPEQLELLNNEYTILLASVIKGFIDDNNINEIDAVCSHGHTILHQPKKGYTLQIGNLPGIETIIGQPVVCDFRVQDVKLGGQGAPLVPIGDRLLFTEYDYCLNLGGFSNISFEENGKRIAYDICPVNTVLNHFAGYYGKDYDDGGEIASGGKINPELLIQLNNLEYYQLLYPKSLGFEFVKENILPIISNYDIPVADVLRTFTEHIALQIAAAIQNEAATALITGGGAYNTYLINRIKQLAPHIEIKIPDDKTIQYKEALIFALLGVLRLREEINVLCSVTGASADHSSGTVYMP
jgi:anhydro-N-acetylmuramic acid kinase